MADDPPELLGVFQGPAHVLVAQNHEASLFYGDELLGRPIITWTGSNTFHLYLVMVMDRVYLTGKEEIIEIPTGRWDIYPWYNNDDTIGGVSLRLRRYNYPRHAAILKALAGALTTIAALAAAA